MPAIALVYALYGDTDQAERAARSAIEARLAACANILSACLSVYRWEGAVQSAGEHPVLFKTRSDLVMSLADHLRAGHGYALPAVSHWEAETDEAFARWVDAETRVSGGDAA